MFELPFILFGTVFLFMFAGFFVVIGREIQHGLKENKANNVSPIQETQSEVVAKRTSVSGIENTSTSYYATFEDNNGVRSEFRIKGAEYGMLAEGDHGLLRHQRTRYLGFTREVTK